MRREYIPVGKPAKRYSPAASVGVLRFNPVPWLKIATTTSGTTAPLGSVMVPETAASWVCAHAPTEMSAENAAGSMQRRYAGRFAPRGAPAELFASLVCLIDSASSFFIAPLSLRKTIYSKALRQNLRR